MVDFTGQFGQIRLAVPASVDSKQCVGMTIQMENESQWILVSQFGEGFIEYPASDASEAHVIAINALEELDEHGVQLPEMGDVYGIGIMCLHEVSAANPYTIEIESITFHMLSEDKGDVPKQIAPDVTDDMTLLNTYGTVFQHVGVFSTLPELQNPAALLELKKQYNSITTGNISCFDGLVGGEVSFISIEEAKKLSYVIPKNYKDSVVPKLNFETLDEVLKICDENDLGFRFLALMGPQETNGWFFRTDYKETESYVNPEVMDARLEMYIRTVMEHVYGGKYGSVVYAWDVNNEYFHRDPEKSHFVKVYGQQGLRPADLKLAYETADDVLRKYGIRDKVSLVFNEYDTYLMKDGRNMTEDIIDVLAYINSDSKVCDTIGMQTHLDTDIPIDRQKNAILAFLDAGYEVQFTEANVYIKIPETGKEDQERYYCELMNNILEIAGAGGKIEGITFGATGDIYSWLPQYDPLLFIRPGQPKDIYYKVLQIYLDAGFEVK